MRPAHELVSNTSEYMHFIPFIVKSTDITNLAPLDADRALARAEKSSKFSKRVELVVGFKGMTESIYIRI